MKKIFIPTPLDEIIELPKDVTHHVLHVFRHNMEKPITVTGSDNRCGTYQITAEVDGKAQAKLIEYVEGNLASYRTILVQSLLKGEKLEWVLQKATELNVDTIYLVPTANCVAKYDEKKASIKSKSLGKNNARSSSTMWTKSLAYTSSRRDAFTSIRH